MTWISDKFEYSGVSDPPIWCKIVKIIIEISAGGELTNRWVSVISTVKFILYRKLGCNFDKFEILETQLAKMSSNFMNIE